MYVPPYTKFDAFEYLHGSSSAGRIIAVFYSNITNKKVWKQGRDVKLLGLKARSHRTPNRSGSKPDRILFIRMRINPLHCVHTDVTHLGISPLLRKFHRECAYNTSIVRIDQMKRNGYC